MLCGMLQRAYALLEIKALDDEQRVIDGIASTPTPDRRGDVMEPKGAQFDLPMPFLWQHNQSQPIGEVFEASVTPSGIRIKARIAKIDEPGTLKDRIDEAWLSIKNKLVRGLSIGWNPIEAARIDTGGLHVLKWLWAELSAVTIPQNVEATILRVKELDQAASGRHLPGVAGLPIVKAKGKMTVQEQITSFENSRAAKVAEMNAIMSAASSSGSTLDAEQTEQYDGLAAEVKAIDDHLPRLRLLEKTNVATATPITKVVDTKTGSDLRGGAPVVQVKDNLPKGTAYTRYVIAKIIGKNSTSDAIRYAESRADWMEQTPVVVDMLKANLSINTKAVTNPGTIAEPAWAAPLAVQRPIDDFLELLRPRTIIGRIPNLRNVPFNISVPVQTGGGTYGWVGEGAPKPVGQLQLASATLGIAKAAGIIVISAELAKISNPSAEQVVRNDMIAGMAQYLDTQFIDPTVAAVANLNPASITNGANGYGTAGTSSDNARTDIKKGITLLTQSLYNIGDVVIIMSEANAFALAGAITTLGVRPFPDITAQGGTILGVPVVTSQAAGQVVAFAHAPSILFADDGGVTIDVSQEASIEMNTVPTSPATASTILVNLWQQNLIGLRAERFINWKRARTTAVVYTTATYV